MRRIEALSKARKRLKKIKVDNALFLAALFPHPKRMLQANQPLYTNVIIYGQQGFGKSETAKWLVRKAKEFYGSKHVSAFQSDRVGMLVLDGLRGKPINILVAEDLTLQEVRPLELKNFYRVRHKAMELGMKKGLIITIVTVHDLFSIPKALRTFASFIIACNAPTNEFDRNVLKRYFSASVLETLEDIQKLKHFDDRTKAYKAFWFQGFSGFIKTELVDEKIPKLEPMASIRQARPRIAAWKKYLGKVEEEEVEEEEEGMEHYADEYDEFY